MDSLLSDTIGVLDKRFLSRSLGLLNPKPPLLVKDSATLRDALEVLQANKVGCVIITDDKGKIAGIFSERDVVLKICLNDIDLDTTCITEYMTHNPSTTEMTATMAYALNMMSHGGYRHLPIVDETNCPLGIISVKDIVDYLVDTLVGDLE